MAALALQDVKDYIGIDYSDTQTDRLLERLMVVADQYLIGSIGADYPKTDERAKQLALLVISDLFENRETTDKVSGSVRRLVDDFSLQLRMELIVIAI